MSPRKEIWIYKVAEWFPFYNGKKTVMSNDTVTHIFDGRYNPDPGVLRRFLVKKYGFKQNEIKTERTNKKGLQVKVPKAKELTKVQKAEITKEFADARERKKARGGESSEDES